MFNILITKFIECRKVHHFMVSRLMHYCTTKLYIKLDVIRSLSKSSTNHNVGGWIPGSPTLQVLRFPLERL